MSKTDSDRYFYRMRVLKTVEQWNSWLVCRPLIRALESVELSDRKLRLYMAACLRHLVGTRFLGEQEWVIETLELHADIPPTEAEILAIAMALREIRLRCTAMMGGLYWEMTIDCAVEPVTDLRRNAWETAESVIVAVASSIRNAAGVIGDRPEYEERAGIELVVCDILRCIFENPFMPVSFLPEWRTIEIVSLAREMYDSRDFSRMPILAELLLSAGCNDEQIITHCREARNHVRGCWVVDRILDRA